MASRKTGSDTPKEDSRLSRIRENQRRSRARKREYLEDLEGRWKKCQELGVQANVELQKAAKRVIEENTLLRRILAEMGLEPVQIDKRLQELRDATVIDTNSDNTSGVDNGCGSCTISGRNPDGTSDDMVAFLESSKTLQPLSKTVPLGKGIETDPIDLSGMDVDAMLVHVNESPALPTIHDPIFDMSLFEGVPNFEDTLNIAQFLELFDPSPTPSENSFAPTDQQAPSSSSSLVVPVPSASPAQIFLQACSSTSSTSKSKNTTPCTEAYALLKALNTRRQEHEDMSQIVLELWDGFCYLEPGEDDEGKGCRVDNDMLQRVIDRLKCKE